jgi:hypothetical protein
MVDAKSSLLERGDFFHRPGSPRWQVTRRRIRLHSCKWKKDGALFAIQHNGNYYFPIYALDAEVNYRPYKALSDVLHIFGEAKNGW